MEAPNDAPMEAPNDAPIDATNDAATAIAEAEDNSKP
jgi:hypothetical protein